VRLIDHAKRLLAKWRAPLTMRKLRGEPLTLRERGILRALNALLKAVLPKHDRLPKDVLDAIEEVERLRR